MAREKTYFESEGVQITSAFVRGKSGVYELDQIVGIEAKLAIGRILIFGAICLALFLFGISQSGAIKWVFVLGAIVSGYAAQYYCVARPMFVRTAAGITPLGISADWKQRYSMIAAFAKAKGKKPPAEQAA